MISDLVYRLRALFQRRSMETEMEQELREHLEHQVEKYVYSGMSRQEAERQAKMKLGGVEQIKEECRDSWGVALITELRQDVRYRLRQLRCNPGFTAVAVLTLALGIGTSTTIFSVVWRPMLYEQPERLLVVWESSPDGGRSQVSVPTYLDWQRQNVSFEDLAAVRSSSVALSLNPPIQLSGARVTSNFFRTFRLRPSLGRLFSDSEFQASHDRVALLGYEIWQTQFAADRSILGRAIRVNGETYIVVGVAPARFEFWGRTDVWMPLVASGATNRQDRDLLVVGRIRPGVAVMQANEEMRTLAARVALAAPDSNRRWSALAQTLQEALAGPGVKLMLMLLFVAVSVVLVMASANVANLLLARGTARQKEIAVRLALGASRGRVVRQLLAETLVLAGAGGAVGLLLALAAVRYLATLPVLQAPALAPIEINRAVLAFAASLSLAATVLSGFVPALRTTSGNLMEHVKASGRTAVGDRAQRGLLGGLVMAELALSLTLMVVAGISLRGFIYLVRVDPGFPTRGLLAGHVTLPAPQYADPARVRAFYSELLARVSAVPGIENAAVSTGIPPLDFGHTEAFRVEGRDPVLASASGSASYQVVSPTFFRTLGLAVINGRAFTELDRAGQTPVAIVNHRLAEKFFPAGDALGKRLLISDLVPGRDRRSEPVACEIAGVVNDLKNSRLSEPAEPEIYRPYQQAPSTSEYVVVRSKTETGSLLGELRNALSAVDPDLPLTEVGTMDERFADSLAGGRVVVVLMLVFASMALFMGSVGLYGVISYSVNRRTMEFALRLALGARRQEIYRIVASAALRLLLMGGAIGTLLALAAARLLRSIVFGVSPYDPATFIAVALILLSVVLTASYLPARRATKVDPMVALRYE